MTRDLSPANWFALTSGLDAWTASTINQHLVTHEALYSYDSQGRISQISQDGGSTATQFAYTGGSALPTTITQIVLTTTAVFTNVVNLVYETNNVPSYGQLLSVTRQSGQTPLANWHAPVSGDITLASDNNQLLFLHNATFSYDSYGRLTEVNEDSGAKITTFSYTNNQITSITETTNQTSGTFTQTTTIVYNTTNQISSATQSTQNVPVWTSAVSDEVNESAQIRQLLAVHPATYTYDSNYRLTGADEDSGKRVTTLTYPTLGFEQPVTRLMSTIENLTSSQDVNFQLDITRTVTASSNGVLQGVA